VGGREKGKEGGENKGGAGLERKREERKKKDEWFCY